MHKSTMSPVKQLALPLDDPSAADRSALNELFSQSARYRSSAAFVELMKFIARFPRYSPYNCMLLHIQNPEVTYVATPNQWSKRFDRTVKRTARPRLILAPKCPVLFVYDLADTKGEYLPEQLKNPYEVRGKFNNELWAKTLENCLKDRIYVDPTAKFSFLHAGTAFRLRSSNQRLKEHPNEPFDFLVEVSQDQDLASQYATLAHELGHIYSGHLGSREGDKWEDRRCLAHQQVEVEAESIAYLVCRRRGIETKSEQYLAQFSDANRQMPDISLEIILSVAYHIERMAEEILPDHKKEREKA